MKFNKNQSFIRCRKAAKKKFVHEPKIRKITKKQVLQGRYEQHLVAIPQSQRLIPINYTSI